MALLPAEGPFRQVVRSGSLLFCSGVVCADVVGGESARGDIASETRVVLSAISDLLVEHGSSIRNVVRADVYVADVSLKPAMDSVYKEFFPTGSEPARTTVGVTGMYDDCLVEITVIAEAGAGTA